MRIDYVVGEPPRGESGVSKKIASQVDTWRELGHEVRLHHLPENGAASSIRWLRALQRLLSPLRDSDADVVYLRHTTWVPSLHSLMRRQRVVLELNGDDLGELRSRRLAYRAYHRAVRRAALRGAAAVVTPTKELAERSSLGGLARRVHTVANGVDLRAVAPLPAPSNERPRLGFTYTTLGDWAGLDHVLELASALPELDFDVIGPSSSGPAPANVTFVGYLTGEGYRAAMSRIDIGIGSLALYRTRLEEGCTLKVRGYLSLGIPTIVGYTDTDFPDGASFLLSVPNRPGGALDAVDAIRAFVRANVGQRVPRSEIQHLDVRAKEADRLGFLQSVAQPG